MSSLGRLQKAKNISDLSGILGFQKKKLAYIIYKKNSSANYKKFDIPKKTGGVRHITASTQGLKLLQKRLSIILMDCMDEIYSQRYPEKNKKLCCASHGFSRGLSIVTNAEKHHNRRYVFNADIKDFFGSINFGRVRGFFIKDKNFGLKPQVATIIAQIACFENKLPQGSPCSPVVSNLIGNILDAHLLKLARNNHCTYTRYADDLTFSSNERSFPQSIAIQKDESHVWLVGPEVIRILRHSGFELNHRKTRMQYFYSRQDVTGLTVNEKVNVQKDYRKRVRAMVHRLIKDGNFFVSTTENEKNNKTHHSKVEGRIDQLHGMLGFIDSIEQHNKKKYRKEGRVVQNIGNESVYRKFLFYKEIYAAERPLLICEGWTDYVYIENAIRHSKDKYPLLIQTDDTGKSIFSFKRLKHFDGRTCQLLGIKSGGTSNIKSFIDLYKKESKKFSAPGRKHPVIILLDNDDAGQKVLKAVRKSFHIKETDSDYTCILGNLYVVLTHSKENNGSIIEDFFDKNTLDVKVGGKTFDRQNKDKTETTYSKAVFAKQVVEKNQDSINFSGFSPLLDTMSRVIQIHNKKSSN